MAYLKRINAVGVDLPHTTNPTLSAWVLDSTAAGRGVATQIYTGTTMTRSTRKRTLAEAIEALAAAGYDTADDRVNMLMIPASDMIPLSDYAAAHNVTPQTMRDRIKRGLHPEAVKPARDWMMPADAPYRPDGRRK